MKNIAFGGVALALSCLPAFADTASKFEAGLGLSAFGPAISAGYHMSDNVVLRGMYSTGISNAQTFDEDGITYKIDGQLGGSIPPNEPRQLQAIHRRD